MNTIKNIEIIYNVPYSPEYNPIERMFLIIKNKIKKANYTNKNMKTKIINILNRINKKLLNKFYKKSFEF